MIRSNAAESLPQLRAAAECAGTLVVCGGELDTTHSVAADAGERPQVEYMELDREYDIPILSVNALEGSSLIARVAKKIATPSWAFSFALRFSSLGSQPMIATGEDIGYPLALLNGLTGAGNRSVAIITHGSYLNSPKTGPTLQALRRIPGVQCLCLSETLRQRLIKQHNFPAHRVHNIGYGVDTRFFTPRETPADPPRQIMSAGMATRDYKTLAAAASRLPNISVKIAADSAWFRSDLDIGDSALPPNVTARSYENYVRLRELYASSAFAVVPLYPAVHACGYAVIYEAMAMGKPVISTRIEGRSDIIIDGETGFYVQPGEPEELRDRIQYLMDRPAMIRDMGQRARALIESKCTVEQFTGRIIAASKGASTTYGVEFSYDTPA